MPLLSSYQFFIVLLLRVFIVGYMIPEKQEILFLLASTLSITGILGLVTSPVLGLFPMTMMKAFIYTMIGGGLYVLALQEEARIRKYTRVISYFFGLLSMSSIVMYYFFSASLPLNVADISLYAFFAIILLYLSVTKHDKEISLLKSA